MQSDFNLRETMGVIHTATDHTRQYVEGMSIGTLGPLRHVHYDKPLWWNTDYFQAIQVPPEEVIQTIRDFRPGPYILGVITADTEAAMAAYAALGYEPMPGKAEPLMARSLVGYTGQASRHFVQQAKDERQRELFNSVIDADDPHGQMSPRNCRTRPSASTS